MSARKLPKFLILLENESLLYFPGAFLAGKVLLELDEETPLRGLFFHIVGEGVVRLSDRASGGRHNDRENYIDFRMRLLDEGQERDEVVVLSPGVHTFPFRLGLPVGLPSTFLGKHGWVQYYCKAALKEASGLTHKNQQVFLVMNPIDLNLEPSLLMQPFHCEAEKNLGLPCVRSGPVSCKVRLDRGGYVPGESIVLDAVVDNDSHVAIKSTKAMLTETIQYTAKNKLVHSEMRELASLCKGEVLPGQSDRWAGELLYIPALPPTNLRGCHLIRVQYDVYFVVEPKGPPGSGTLKLQLPIMLATYPVRNQDGTVPRRKGCSYPLTLPVSRPWLNGRTVK